MTKRRERRLRSGTAADARWQRKLQCDEALRRLRRNGLTGYMLAQAEAVTLEEFGPPSWQALLFDTEEEAEEDLAALAKANKVSIHTLRLSLKTPDELKDAVDQLSDKDLILIDTAGRSQTNAMHMGELRSFLHVLPSPEVHLVLSATTRLQDMLNVATRFAETGFDRLIITKIDETSFYGSLYQVPRLIGKPLSYLTTGQSVPDDIDVAAGDRVARLIMGDAP